MEAATASRWHCLSLALPVGDGDGLGSGSGLGRGDGNGAGPVSNPIPILWGPRRRLHWDPWSGRPGQTRPDGTGRDGTRRRVPAHSVEVGVVTVTGVGVGAGAGVVGRKGEQGAGLRAKKPRSRRQTRQKSYGPRVPPRLASPRRAPSRTSRPDQHGSSRAGPSRAERRRRDRAGV